MLSEYPTDFLVVDIGGAMKPLSRANVIIDYQQIDELKLDGNQTFDTWISMDFGGSQKYELPFPDKFVDFVWCTQTLEDIADPFQLMREMIRIGKMGYIEIPNRQLESTIGIESTYYTGFCHHRWYGEIIDSTFQLTHKSPFVMEFGAFQEPPLEKNLSFLWDTTFKFSEKILLTKDDIIGDIIDFRQNRYKNQVGVF